MQAPGATATHGGLAHHPCTEGPSPFKASGGRHTWRSRPNSRARLYVGAAGSPRTGHGSLSSTRTVGVGKALGSLWATSACPLSLGLHGLPWGQGLLPPPPRGRAVALGALGRRRKDREGWAGVVSSGPLSLLRGKPTVGQLEAGSLGPPWALAEHTDLCPGEGSPGAAPGDCCPHWVCRALAGWPGPQRHRGPLQSGRDGAGPSAQPEVGRMTPRLSGRLLRGP